MEKCSCVQSYTAGGSILCDPSKAFKPEPFTDWWNIRVCCFLQWNCVVKKMTTVRGLVFVPSLSIYCFFQIVPFSTVQILFCLLRIQRSLICPAGSILPSFDFIFRYVRFESDFNLSAHLSPPFLRILQKLGIKLLNIAAVMSHAFAHLVFNLMLRHTAFCN